MGGKGTRGLGTEGLEIVLGWDAEIVVATNIKLVHPTCIEIKFYREVQNVASRG